MQKSSVFAEKFNFADEKRRLFSTADHSFRCFMRPHRTTAAPFVLSTLLAFWLLGGVAWSKPAPAFWLSSVENQRFDSREQSAPYVISFFYIGCPPCVEEIPALHRWMQQNAPEGALLFISPLQKDSKQAIQQYAEELGVPARLFYSDPFGNVQRKFFPEQAKMVFPTLIGVSQGKVVFVKNALDEQTFLALEQLFP
jgi:thiol-disulfide isomerase/thioredoxin